MRIFNASVLGVLGLMLLGHSASALMLAPGDSGNLASGGTGATGSVLASSTGEYDEDLSDAIVGDNFTSTVTRTAGGQLVFTYTISPYADLYVTVPHLVTLTGFGGTTTDVSILAGSHSMAWTATRSADGSTLTFAVNPPAAGDDIAGGFTVEVETDGGSYGWNPAAFAGQYWAYPYPPPGVTPIAFLTTIDAGGYTPGVGAAPVVPEPSEILLLPLALAALAWRYGRRGPGGAGG